MERLFSLYGTTLFFMEKLKPKTNSKLDPYLLFFLPPNYVNLKKTLSISLSSNPHEFYMGFFGR